MEDQEDPKYEELSDAIVDGAKWYTVKCSKEVAQWVRQEHNDNNQWYEHIDSNWNIYFNIFDMHEEFFMMLKLRWGV